MLIGKNYHSFHILDKSPWPLIVSMSSMNLMMSIIFMMENQKMMMMLLNFLMLLWTSMIWWRDVSRESSFQGNHSFSVLKSLKLSMVLFISSEVMFFFCFFWTFFYSSLAPEFEIGNKWPSFSIIMFNPYEMPLLNTITLLSSGVTVTVCHHSILKSMYSKSMIFLFMTVFLGTIFTFFQYMEYFWSTFSSNDNVFGSIFFLSTGFHGFHVIIGTVFLLVSLYRMMFSLFNNKHHFGFEAAAWYWHFVDIVWLFLYTWVYWWFYYF